MKNKLIIIPAVIIVALLMVPLPVVVINVMYVIALASSITILVVELARKRLWKGLPSIVLTETLFILVCSISSTRNILTTKTFEEQNPVLNLVHLNYIVAIILAFILIGVMLFIVMKGTVRVAVAAARFCLDGMNQRLFDIDSRFKCNEISKEESEIEKRILREEIDFYSNLDGSARFLSGTAKTVSYIYLVSIIGGTVIGVFQNSLSLKEASNIYSSVVFFNLLFCMLPILVMAFVIGAAASEKIKIIEKESKFDNEKVMEGNPEVKKKLQELQESMLANQEKENNE